MKKLREHVLFLEGRYPAAHMDFYRKLCRGRYKVAVDGGYRFFRATSIVPDLLIGDFDSLKRQPQDLTGKTKVMTYPRDKNQTDAELALNHSLENGATVIDIVQPSVGELDHFTANLLLLGMKDRGKVVAEQAEIRIISHLGEILLLKDERRIIRGRVGDIVSVLPLSASISLSCTGVEFEARNLKIKRGETAGCRNRMVGKQARFQVKGEAFLFHSFGG